MRKFEKLILIGLAIVLSTVLVAFATDFGAPPGKDVDVSFLPENGYTVLTANTAGFTGATNDVGFTASKFTVTITWGGAAPTSTSTTLQGSTDNSTFATLVTHSSIASGDMYHVVNKPVRYIKGGFASKVGGDATSTVTMKVWAGGN